MIWTALPCIGTLVGSVKHFAVGDDRENGLAALKFIETLEQRRRTAATRMNADIRVEKCSAGPSETVALLRCALGAQIVDRVRRKACQQLECSRHPRPFLAQHDLVPASENLDFVSAKSKLLREANGLAVAGLEHSGGGH
jgi:hypothetical protein